MVAYLADHPELIDTIVGWLEEQWPHYFPDGVARSELLEASQTDTLPIGLVALVDGLPAGITILHPRSVPSHSHLTPWVTRALVAKQYRGSGVAHELLREVERSTLELGYTRLYAGTVTAGRLLERVGWKFLDRATWGGEELELFEKDLVA